MLDFDKVKQLHEAAQGSDKAEISLLHNAVLSGMNAYKDHSTRANKQNWDAAKEGLADLVNKLWPKYFPGDAVATDPMRFDRQKDALAWLHAKGYKVSAGKFSNDWNGGKVRVLSGSVLFSDLLTYATRLDVDHKKVASADQRQAKKDELDIRLKEEQLKRIEQENRKDDARWTLKQDATDQAVALLVLLRATLRHHASTRTPLVIIACGGDSSRAVETDAAIETIFSLAFNELAACREARQIGLVDKPVDDEDDEEADA
jgi:hypothetical protein